ncbi:MAG: cupin domain-containing protein [Solirubrobacteraceae bacterium]
MGLTHLDEAPVRAYALGHLRNRWTLLGDAVGSETIGLRRIEISAGGWSTPVHEHGRSEEIFYVLAGGGVSWHNGQTAAIRAGDCIVYHPRSGAHAVRADDHLDVLAFGMREYDESLALPRLGLSMLRDRAVHSTSGPPGAGPQQYALEADLGPPELPPAPGPRPETIVNIDEVDPRWQRRPRIERARRNLGRAAGSRHSGLQYVEVAAGKESAPPHCHSLEEEIFVILAGDGTLGLDDEETPVSPGTVVGRPSGTGVSHVFRAGSGLTYLAYGTRHDADLCYYPRSNKIGFGGVKLIARLERLDYWDGED